MGATPLNLPCIFVIFPSYVFKSSFLSLNLSILLSSRFDKYKTMQLTLARRQLYCFNCSQEFYYAYWIAGFPKAYENTSDVVSATIIEKGMSQLQVFPSFNTLLPYTDHLSKSNYIPTDCKTTNRKATPGDPPL